VTRTSGGTGEAAPSPERIAELVRQLASVMRQSAVSELDLDFGSVAIRLRRPVQLQPRDAEAPSPPSAPVLADAAVDFLITAPMIGTFYASSTPGAPPFVTEGDDVDVGQTIGVIEAMKIMNEIAADRSGVVEEVLVGNGQPVEYGSPLFRLTPLPDDRE